MTPNKNIKILLNYFLGPLLFVVLSYALYRQIMQQPSLPERWSEIKQSWMQPVFWLGFALVFVNWGLESRKWQLLVRHMQPFSFLKAYESVLAGCSITMLTPYRVGEYGGRVLYLDDHNRLRGITLTILGSMSQLLITLLIGFVGLTYLLFFSLTPEQSIFKLMPLPVAEVLWGVLLLVVIVMLLLYFRVAVIVRWLEHVSWLAWLVKYVRLLEGFSLKELLKIFSLSILRYLVFILQFLFMLWAMNVDIALGTGLMLLSIFYLVMALAPTLGFTEMPLRAATSAQIIGAYSTNIVGIQAASLAIWLTNIVLPAIAGTIILSGVKFLKKK